MLVILSRFTALVTLILRDRGSEGASLSRVKRNKTSY
jgi:hypothetical protein